MVQKVNDLTSRTCEERSDERGIAISTWNCPASLLAPRSSLLAPRSCSPVICWLNIMDSPMSLWRYSCSCTILDSTVDLSVEDMGKIFLAGSLGREMEEDDGNFDTASRIA